MTPSEKLLIRIQNELDLKIPSGAKIISNHPGHWQRAAGAWSWEIHHSKGMYPAIGSQFTVTRLLKAKKLRKSHEGLFGEDIYIDPE